MNNINITYLEKIIHEMSSTLQNLVLIPDLLLDTNIEMNKVDQQESLGYLRDSAERLTQLARILSVVTNLRNENIKFNLAQADIVELINKEIKYHAMRIKQDKATQINLTLNTNLSDCWAKIDAFWISQLLGNLIINAVNHADQGKIEVTLDLLNENDKEFISLRVTDEGCGIPEDELDEIFEPLKRGSHSVGKVKGSGIGLTIVKEIVEGHKGSIKAFNNENGGATFEVVMPTQLTHIY